MNTLEHLDRVRAAQLSLSSYRRIVNQSINDRLRALNRHELEVRAHRIAGQEHIEGTDEISVEPTLLRIILNPTENID